LFPDNKNGFHSYDLWYDVDSKLCGCNFNIIQIKHFPNCYDHDLITENNSENIKVQIPKSKGAGKGVPPPPPPPKMNINILSTNINSTVIEAPRDIKSQQIRPTMSLDPDTLKNAIANLKKIPI
jgi:hypothetical protein